MSRLALGILLSALGWLALRTHRVAWERTTIPLLLDDTVVDERLLHEKHPGRDDVHLLVLEGGRTIRVTAAVHDAVSPGDRVEKDVGERVLHVGDDAVRLEPSADAEGIAPALALLVAPAVALALLGRRQPRAL